VEPGGRLTSSPTAVNTISIEPTERLRTPTCAPIECPVPSVDVAHLDLPSGCVETLDLFDDVAESEVAFLPENDS
jgi:hypothetical protein